MASYVELHSCLSARIFGALAATLGSGITNSQMVSFAASSAAAGAAILEALPNTGAPALPEAVETEARWAAAIFAGLASGLTTITSAQITALAGAAVAALSAVQAAVAAAAGSISTEGLLLQIDIATEVFAGLAQGMASITFAQIDAIAVSAAAAAGAIIAAQ